MRQSQPGHGVAAGQPQHLVVRGNRVAGDPFIAGIDRHPERARLLGAGPRHAAARRRPEPRGQPADDERLEAGGDAAAARSVDRTTSESNPRRIRYIPTRCIAFASLVNGRQQIFVANIDGSGERPLLFVAPLVGTGIETRQLEVLLVEAGGISVRVRDAQIHFGRQRGDGRLAGVAVAAAGADRRHRDHHD